MSETMKAQALDRIWDSVFNEEGDELDMVDLEAAYDAGYQHAVEDFKTAHRRLQATDEPFSTSDVLRYLGELPK